LLDEGTIYSYRCRSTAQTNCLDNERNAVEIRRRRVVASVLLVKGLGGGRSASCGLALNRAHDRE
jgi:hypothetical protein